MHFFILLDLIASTSFTWLQLNRHLTIFFKCHFWDIIDSIKLSISWSTSDLQFSGRVEILYFVKSSILCEESNKFCGKSLEQLNKRISRVDQVTDWISVFIFRSNSKIKLHFVFKLKCQKNWFWVEGQKMCEICYFTIDLHSVHKMFVSS